MSAKVDAFGTEIRVGALVGYSTGSYKNIKVGLITKINPSLIRVNSGTNVYPGQVVVIDPTTQEQRNTQAKLMKEYSEYLDYSSATAKPKTKPNKMYIFCDSSIQTAGTYLTVDSNPDFFIVTVDGESSVCAALKQVKNFIKVFMPDSNENCLKLLAAQLFSISHYSDFNNNHLYQWITSRYTPSAIRGFGPRSCPKGLKQFHGNFDVIHITGEEFWELVKNEHD